MTFRLLYPTLFVWTVLAGCGDDDAGPAMARDGGPPTGRDAGYDGGRAAGRDAGGVGPVDAGLGGPLTVAGGDVMGDWCGEVTVTASVTVPAGATLTVCAGTVVTFADGAGMAVAGTLVLAGTIDLPIAMTSGGRWQGLAITGTLDGAFTDITKTGLAIEGRAGSTVTFDDSTIATSTIAFTLANGATMDRTAIVGGSTSQITGGVLRMSHSTIDLRHPTAAPDCTAYDGASGAVLDHVRFTGCHCPMHIVGAGSGITVTNSILDGATNPAMIAHTTATFHGNHFLGVGTLMLDIGGGITADVAGNYWGGGAPNIGTGDPSQFIGSSDYSTTPIVGAGP